MRAFFGDGDHLGRLVTVSRWVLEGVEGLVGLYRRWMV
jgi:hypothetical protein